jgi:superoxide dismutase, Cu-Zn family
MRAGVFGLAMFLGLGGGGVAALAGKAPPPKKEEPAKTPPPAAPPAGPKATAEVKDAAGKVLGTVTLEQGGAGLLITGELSGLPPGDHALHLHETGKCEAPFKTAGGHFNPGGKKHGIKHSEGMHAGDLPNLHVGADGKVRFDAVAPGVSLDKENKLLDADGTAVVIHAKADDYSGDPAGNAGDRIACGVVTLAK